MALSVEDRQYIAQIAAETIKEMGVAQKHDPASLTLAAPAVHGPFQGNASQFGIFADPTVRPQRWSTLARPPRGVYGLSTLRRSIYVKERLELMSGVTAAAGTNATGWCGNPPTVGQGKVCAQDYEWGELFLKTNLNAIPLLGQERRGEVPAEIYNASPIARNPLIPEVMYDANLNSQLAYELYLMGVHTERLLDKVAVTGDNSKASNATEVGFISEPDGLDLQIKTGHADARTGLLCAAADSVVLSFNADVAGTIGGGDGRNIVQAVSDTYWGVRQRADAFGMPEATFALVTRRESWRALVETWVCQYYTYRCSGGTAGQPNTTDTQSMNALRLEMMQGQYLLVDNIQLPVVFSEGIVRDGIGANHFKSDMYIVPLEWMGIPLLTTEYFPMDNPGAVEYASFVNADAYRTLNNGLWAVASRDAGFCKEYLFGAKFRLILETPWLAARVDDVSYTFRAPIRNSDPADSWFYANGGATFNAPLA